MAVYHPPPNADCVCHEILTTNSSNQTLEVVLFSPPHIHTPVNFPFSPGGTVSSPGPGPVLQGFYIRHEPMWGTVLPTLKM